MKKMELVEDELDRAIHHLTPLGDIKKKEIHLRLLGRQNEKNIFKKMARKIRESPNAINIILAVIGIILMGIAAYIGYLQLCKMK